MNIVSMAMNYLGPSIISKISSSLGISESVVNKMIGMALPSIMGSLMGSSRTTAGAEPLFDAVSNLDWGGSDRNVLEGALDSGSFSDFSSMGGGLLSGLIGGKPMEALTGALGRQTGLDASQSGSMLGMLAPVALGAMRDKVDADGLDAAGLASFLGDQRSNIAKAMPAEFAGELKGSDLLGSMGDLFGDAGAAVAGAAGAARDGVAGLGDTVTDGAQSLVDGTKDAVSATTENVRDALQGAGDVAETANGGISKWIWLIAAAILAFLAWQFLGSSPEPEANMTPSGESIMIGDVNVAETFSTSVDGFKTALGTVTDADSARAVLPQIEEFGASLDSIGGMVGDIPESAQGAFSTMINGALGSLQPLIESVLGQSGVADVLGPVLQGVVEKLTALAG